MCSKAHQRFIHHIAFKVSCLQQVVGKPSCLLKVMFCNCIAVKACLFCMIYMTSHKYYSVTMQQLAPTTHAVQSLRVLYEELRNTTVHCYSNMGNCLSLSVRRKKVSFYPNIHLRYRVNCCCFIF